MKIETVPSFSLPLGAVEPNWHQAEFDRDLDADVTYESHDQEGRASFPGNFDSVGVFSMDLTEDQKARLVDNLRPPVVVIDRMVRELRGYESTQPLRSTVTYRVGLDRAAGLVSLISAILQKPWDMRVAFLPSGSSHFDLDKREEAGAIDVVILGHRGNTTEVYEGPVYRVSSEDSGSINGTLGFAAALGDFLAAVRARPPRRGGAARCAPHWR